MTTLADDLLAGSPPDPLPDAGDQPRVLGNTRSRADWAFIFGSGGIGTVVLILTVLIGIFLGAQLVHTIHRFGFNFFTEHQWSPSFNLYGIKSALIGTFEVAAIALLFSFPLALLVALFVSEFAPRQIKATLIT